MRQRRLPPPRVIAQAAQAYYPGMPPTSAGDEGPHTARFTAEQLGWDRANCTPHPAANQQRGRKIYTRGIRGQLSAQAMGTERAPDFEPKRQQRASVERGTCRVCACTNACVYAHTYMECVANCCVAGVERLLLGACVVQSVCPCAVCVWWCRWASSLTQGIQVRLKKHTHVCLNRSAGSSGV